MMTLRLAWAFERRRRGHGFIYVAEATGHDGPWIKVGFSLDPVERMRVLERASRYKFRLMGCFVASNAAEHRLHRVIRGYNRTNGASNSEFFERSRLWEALEHGRAIGQAAGGG